MGDTNWLAIIVVGAVTSLGLGGLWYGPLFGKIWSAETGITKDTKHRYSIAQMMGGSVLFSIIAAFMIDHAIGDGGPIKGLHIGFFAGLLLCGGALATAYLWESRTWRHWLVNAGYTTVQYSLIGLALGYWR